MKKFIIPGTILFLMTSIKLSAQKKVETRFHVSGVCGMCKERIEKATDIKGVHFSEWDKEAQELFLVYKPEVIHLDSIHSLIQLVGHDTEKGKASQDCYDKVHSCCRYRDPEIIDADR